MAANVTGRVLRAFGPPEAEEVLDNVFTVGDVRKRMGLQEGDYQAKINKDFAGDNDTIDRNDTVTFSRKATGSRVRGVTICSRS
jgi:hypothetical protein